jgi:hypothetical protein
MKTHKKDPGNQKRKKPAETAAGSFTQAAPYGGNALNSSRSSLNTPIF